MKLRGCEDPAVPEEELDAELENLRNVAVQQRRCRSNPLSFVYPQIDAQPPSAGGR